MLKSIRRSLVMGVVLSLAFGFLYFYHARRDAALVTTAGTASAVVMQHQPINSNDKPLYLRCDYSFNVNGEPYVGHAVCPPQGGNAAKAALLDLAGARPMSTATVYYDPADPEFNSLTDFGVQGERDSLRAKMCFGLAAACLVCVLVLPMLTATVSKPNEGVIVDDQGTVIYPDKISKGSNDSD